MSQRKNEFSQPIGESVVDWTGAKRPGRELMQGQFCRVEILELAKHLNDLFDAFSVEGSDTLWTYMTVGPFMTVDAFRTWMESACKTDDPLFYALIDLKTNKAVGLAAYMRIKPSVGVIEVGHITYSLTLQKTAIATEAMFLMMSRVFNELGYRRYEWKCDSLNAASRDAAQRLGFCYEGLFKQALVYKGRNRDTAWFSILDSDWPKIEKAFIKWLDKDNFDQVGQQKKRLEDFMKK